MNSSAPLHLNRRCFLRSGVMGIGSLALASLMKRDLAAATTTHPAVTHLPRAKHVIFLHMVGGPSQMDLFDPKPALAKYEGQTLPESITRGRRFAFVGPDSKVISSPYGFSNHGAAGMVFSELLPHMAGVADDWCMIRSLKTDVINHSGAQLFMHTGSGLLGRPSFGSWLSYGLGTENENLPAFIVMTNGMPTAGAPIWSAGFLPSQHQGLRFRGGSESVFFLNDPADVTRERRGRIVEGVNALNREVHERYHDPEVLARIAQYEMAFKMQASVPELTNLTHEPQHILDLYGIEDANKDTFARNCLLARRMVEQGVRFVQLYVSGWDHHDRIYEGLPKACRQVDQATAGLIRDLKQRGLLDDTLVIWGGEFGRTPMAQVLSASGDATPPGRDHHIDSFTALIAGGGFKGGLTYGATDDYGFGVTENPIHVHDLQATLLHQLGLDHEQLTYRYQGRDFRLTDVHGKVVKAVLA
jgi:hypothetical protein